MNDAQRFQRVAELFEIVRAKHGAEGDAFLENACRDSPETLAEVRRLLARHDDDGMLDTPIVPREASTDAIRAVGTSALPARIGRYRVKRELGVGGMGIVCLAEQDKPRREVAIKLIRPGLVTRELLKRFDRETALLGRLQHPGIAQIYEAGTDDDGSGARPFFAMEFVDGAPLLDHVREHDLDLRNRLEIFVRICDAVEHAHRRGIIHRDLKPGNILVDRSGQPKILDFGVARATESDLQVSTLQTDVGQLIGTVAYMSPEQVCGRASDIDTRSDVYGLGVILYELLAERLPYDLNDRTIAAAARVISEQDPTSLSTVDRSYRGDLHTIVHKALEKDPDRRYQSASALGADVRHFLNDEPIVARPATTAYQLRKFAKRNKALVAGVLIAFLAVGAGAVAATFGMVRARGEAARAEAMNTFMERVLVAADSARSGDVRLADLLRDAGDRVDIEFAEQPELRLRVHRLLTLAFSSMLYHEEAVHHARRWLEEAKADHGDGHEDTRSPRVALASELSDLMQLDEAERLVRSVLDDSDETARDAVTLRARAKLGNVLAIRGRYEEAERELRRALRQAEESLGRFNVVTLAARNSLGKALDNRGLHGNDPPEQRAAFREEAAGLLRQVIDDEPQTGGQWYTALHARQRLSDYARGMGRYEEAMMLAREGMDLAKAWLGSDHPLTVTFERRLARALHGLGESRAAAAHIKHAVTQIRDVQRDRIQTVVTMVIGMPILDAAEEWETMRAYAQDIADAYGGDPAKGGFGLEARIYLPYLYTRLGAADEAVPLFDELLAHEGEMGERYRARLHYARAIWCIDRGDLDAAGRHLARAVEFLRIDAGDWPTQRLIEDAMEAAGGAGAAGRSAAPPLRDRDKARRLFAADCRPMRRSVVLARAGG